MKPNSIAEWKTIFKRPAEHEFGFPISQLQREWDLVAKACREGRSGGECKRCWALDPSCNNTEPCAKAQPAARDRAIKSTPLYCKMLIYCECRSSSNLANTNTPGP